MTKTIFNDLTDHEKDKVKKLLDESRNGTRLTRREFLKLLAILGIAGTVTVLGIGKFVDMWKIVQATATPPPRPKDYDYGELDWLNPTLLGKIRQNLVVEWLFTEGKGNVIHDYSGHRNNGHVYGHARWSYVDKVGYVFVGDGHTFIWTEISQLYPPISVEVIAYDNSVPFGTRGYAGIGVFNIVTPNANIKPIEKHIIFPGYWMEWNTPSKYTSSSVYWRQETLHRWLHVIVSFDRNYIRVLFDGQLVKDGPAFDTNKTSQVIFGNCRIEAMLSYFNTYEWIGYFKLVRVWTQRLLHKEQMILLHKLAKVMVPYLP